MINQMNNVQYIPSYHSHCRARDVCNRAAAGAHAHHTPPTRPNTRVEGMDKPNAWARAPRYLIQVDRTQKMWSVLAFRATPGYHTDVSTSDSGASPLARGSTSSPAPKGRTWGTTGNNTH